MEKKLGWGNFSTVWQCSELDKETQVAVKVNKSHEEVAEMVKDEIKLLQRIGKTSASHNGGKFCCSWWNTLRWRGPMGGTFVWLWSYWDAAC